MDRDYSADFERNVLPHLDAGYRLARWLMRSDQDAEDAVQEASLRAFKYFHTFDGRDARSWFLTIVRNICNTAYARAHTGHESFDEERHVTAHGAGDPEALAARRDDVTFITRVLNSLPERFRTILVLREIEGLSYRELAGVIGIPAGTVMSSLSRARQAFRDAARRELRARERNISAAAQVATIERKECMPSLIVVICLAVTLFAATPARAQPALETTSAPTSATSSVQQDDDGALDRAEPDFVVVNLPTTLRLPLYRGNFRLTHRFAGNLRNGSFSQQAGNLFGIDQGAIIGFEYRFAVARHVEAAFYRSGFDKTIQLYGKYDVLRQQRLLPVSISPIVSVEGTDNFHEKHAPAVGAAISREFGTRVAGYVTPVWVHNTAASLEPIVHDHDDAHAEASEPAAVRRNTTYVGFGGRVRLGASTYIAGEIVPRVQGYAPDQQAYGVSLEKRVGAHMFSLTFTNTFGTTFAQVARGGAANNLFLGFNLGRKFF